MQWGDTPVLAEETPCLTADDVFAHLDPPDTTSALAEEGKDAVGHSSSALLLLLRSLKAAPKAVDAEGQSSGSRLSRNHLPEKLQLLHVTTCWALEEVWALLSRVHADSTSKNVAGVGGLCLLCPKDSADLPAGSYSLSRWLGTTCTSMAMSLAPGVLLLSFPPSLQNNTFHILMK